jgi:hypothetical protein
MKATEAKFLDFLKKSPQFVIPIYQRTYSWTEKAGCVHLELYNSRNASVPGIRMAWVS